ncbi:MAG: hypothetical protein WDO13_21555 [Verrucomicrobiota bacterium]
MRILAFPVTVLLFLLWPGLSSADSFYTDLGSHLTALGLPATDSTIGENGGFGDSEDTALNSFWLVSTTGQASKNVVSVTGLPFEKALRVQSQTAPDETWHHRIAQFVGGTWKTGDTGLLVFSVHSVASEGSPIMKAAITSTDTVTTPRQRRERRLQRRPDPQPAMANGVRALHRAGRFAQGSAHLLFWLSAPNAGNWRASPFSISEAP